ncbi:hypothetical protein RZR97_10010 [Hydrogenimonas thermophila]|uniref:capsular polysaccharide export protein, LipB/KpsS family n=1 Tax=Hydrogenimonas thermophila TaxID=223786 RepID=UPI002936D584|nr:hypothetical protein [Hydrogenimonas thermophila]WOE71946.1 hypothetical protein RZR97_10010 [Hydrogenimonas thermophila]
MKILILEPFYTNFHIDLAKSLTNNIESMVFNIGYIIYLRDSKINICHKKILDYSYSQHDLYLAKNIKNLYTERIRKLKNNEPLEKDFEYMAKYVSYLREFLKDRKIELVLMHNDLRWQHALAIEVCKELEIKYLVTERGIFRPNTTTIDLKGVNANSSIPRKKEFYENINISELNLMSYKSYKISIKDNLLTNIRFAFFILLNKCGDILRINSYIKNKHYSLLNYIKLFIKQKYSVKDKINLNLPEKFVFIPLQVNTDTQILVHSNFKTIQEFITLVEKSFYSLNSDLKLVFKIHPMEQGLVNYQFDSKSFVVENNTNELIKKCEFLITINSTVGFEAIQNYKKVIVLGEAFYKINGIAICSSKDNFLQDLKRTIEQKNEIDENIIDNFVNYLKYEYQVKVVFNNLCQHRIIPKIVS